MGRKANRPLLVDMIALAVTPEFHRFFEDASYRAHLRMSDLLRLLVTKDKVERIVEQRIAEMKLEEGK